MSKSHWDGCWAEHPECTIGEVNRRGNETKRLRTEVSRLSTENSILRRDFNERGKIIQQLENQAHQTRSK